MWKVAIIDDDPNVLQGMKKIIPWNELDLEWAGEGRDGGHGLELIRSTQPDIVITDIYMPVLSGLEMIEKLRDEGYRSKFVILSGYSDFEYARQAVRLQVNEYLSKPVTVRTVRETIGSIVGKLKEESAALSATSDPDLNAVSLKFYHQLAQALRNSQAAHARELVKDYVAHLHDRDFSAPATIRRCMAELRTIISYSLYENGIMVDERHQNAHPQNGAETATTIGQLERWLTGKIDLIIESRQYKENIKHKKAIDTIIAYIHVHYMEDIKLEEAAEIVDISRNYLCVLFKKVTGETFNQYLTRVRMEKAKEMILEGKWLVYEIAEKVGYKNIPYFSTLFKKMTGHAPTDLVK